MGNQEASDTITDVRTDKKLYVNIQLYNIACVCARAYDESVLTL